MIRESIPSKRREDIGHGDSDGDNAQKHKNEYSGISEFCKTILLDNPTSDYHISIIDHSDLSSAHRSLGNLEFYYIFSILKPQLTCLIRLSVSYFS